jgi:hypothetical protein
MTTDMLDVAGGVVIGGMILATLRYGYVLSTDPDSPQYTPAGWLMIVAATGVTAWIVFGR